MFKALILASVIVFPNGVPVTTTYQPQPVSAPRLTVQHGENDFRPAWLPPKEFQSLDRISTKIVFVKDADSFEGCGAYGSYNVLACTTRIEKTMILPNPCQYPNELYARLVCHELGHVRGWRHDDVGKTTK